MKLRVAPHSDRCMGVVARRDNAPGETKGREHSMAWLTAPPFSLAQGAVAPNLARTAPLPPTKQDWQPVEVMLSPARPQLSSRRLM